MGQGRRCHPVWPELRLWSRGWTWIHTGSAGRDTAEGEILSDPRTQSPTPRGTQPGWDQLNPFTPSYIPTASPGLANTGLTAARDWWGAQAPVRDWPGLTVGLRALLQGAARPAGDAVSAPRRVPPRSRAAPAPRRSEPGAATEALYCSEPPVPTCPRGLAPSRGSGGAWLRGGRERQGAGSWLHVREAGGGGVRGGRCPLSAAAGRRLRPAPG